MTTRICMWSGPRNLSTAMMRSFESRSDCAVIDEPFFAPFLAETGKDHPGRIETLAAHENDPHKAAALCLANPAGGETLFFQKHMPHQMLDGFPLDWTRGARHFFLIRHPARVIASYAKGRADFTVEDLGYPQITRFYKILGPDCAVLDCDEILQSPEKQLRALCSSLAIPFDKAMLNWKTGSRLTDGAWAPYWYKSVENSTGFGQALDHLPNVEPKHEAVYHQAKGHYDEMYLRRIRA